jgi:type IV pilus biogenesis protein CpaD/CtpE
MAKQTKMSEQQVRVFVENFAKQARNKYEIPAASGSGHAFVAGYLQSLVSQLLAELPLEKQLHHINVLQESSVWK